MANFLFFSRAVVVVFIFFFSIIFILFYFLWLVGAAVLMGMRDAVDNGERVAARILPAISRAASSIAGSGYQILCSKTFFHSFFHSFFLSFIDVAPTTDDDRRQTTTDDDRRRRRRR